MAASVMLGTALGIPQCGVAAGERLRTRIAALFFCFVWGTKLVWDVLLVLYIV